MNAPVRSCSAGEFAAEHRVSHHAKRQPAIHESIDAFGSLVTIHRQQGWPNPIILCLPEDLV